MPSARRVSIGPVAVVCGVLTALTGCAASTEEPTAEVATVVAAEGWVGHVQALTTAGASPVAQVGDVVADPAGCLTVVGTDHRGQSQVGKVWTAARDCAQFSGQWQATTDMDPGTSLADVIALDDGTLLAVGNGLDKTDKQTAGLVAHRDGDGRWKVTARLARDGSSQAALAISPAGEGLVILGARDGAAAAWLAGDAGEAWRPVDMPSPRGYDTTDARRVAAASDGTLVAAGHGTSASGGTALLLWRSTDDGETWEAASNGAVPGFRLTTLLAHPGGFLALGSDESDATGRALSSTDGVEWTPVDPEGAGALTAGVTTAAGDVVVTVESPTARDCPVTGLRWRDGDWSDYPMPCAAGGQARGTVLADGRIAFLVGDELWIRDR
ncbi:hypothetical protein LX16_2822 [Stackebrandtia albiflava]|uniref:Uncharacterized protein n=1 Tax=Stackebrandtia albiflava TaxID=406432 RepID=A0A562V2H0_9ACTN|nr:hypothetical protein [Stackebrandtia albiflava]TWJ12074.1 hypothetical protein LX16_2822 [Stackebrandtia albiflava]